MDAEKLLKHIQWEGYAFKAFSESLNIPAIKISESIGREFVSELAKGLAYFQTSNGPAIALGTSEATLIDLVGAYATILNSGYKVEPFGWETLKLKKINVNL